MTRFTRANVYVVMIDNDKKSENNVFPRPRVQKIVIAAKCLTSHLETLRTVARDSYACHRLASRSNLPLQTNSSFTFSTALRGVFYAFPRSASKTTPNTRNIHLPLVPLRFPSVTVQNNIPTPTSKTRAAVLALDLPKLFIRAIPT